MDEYEAYLREIVEWYTNWCLEDAAKNGRAGNLKWADMSMRYSLECYEDALEEYVKFRAKQSVESQRDSEADEQIARGDYETFDSIDDFINSLDDSGDKE